MDNVHELIIATLSDHPAALTITEIASFSGLNRHAVARHLDTLELLGKVRKIQQGNAKKYFRVTSVPVSGLIDISSDLIIIVDKNLVIQYINNAAEQKLGLSCSEIVGEPIEMLSADIFSSHDVIEGLKNHSPNKVFRAEVSHPDGTIYSITIIEISLEVGKNLISITAEDITDAKRAEREVVESEEKYKALFRANADPVFLVNQDSGTIVDVNKAACDLYGFGHEDLLGVNIVSIAADPHRTAEFIQKAVPFTPVDYHLHRNGRVFPVELSTVMVQINGVNTVITTTRDITKRVMVEEAIAQIRRNFETFFNTTDDFLFVVSKTGIILEVNRTVIQRLGYSREDLIGSSILIVHPPEKQNEAEENIHSIMAGMIATCKIPLITRNREIIPVETRVTTGEWNGKPAFFGVSKDISQITISEEKFSKAFHCSSLPKAILTLDERRFLDVNNTFLALVHLSREDVIHKTFHEIGFSISPADITHLNKIIDQTDKFQNVEIKFRLPDHSEKTGLISANKINFGEGTYLLVTMVDITCLRKTESALRKSERKFQTLLETLNEGIWAIDKDGYTTYVNPKMEKILGYEPGEMIGRHLFSFMDDEWKAKAQENTRQLIQGTLGGFEFELIRKDGETIFTSMEAVPFLGKNGEYQGAIAGVVDISLQKLKEAELADSEEKYRALFHASPDAVFLITQETGQIMDANPSAERRYGYTRQELLQMKNTDISAEPEKTKLATLNPDPFIPLRYHRHKNGTVFPVEITTSRFTLKDTSFIIATIRDITERVQLEEEKRAREEIFRLIPETINEVFWVADVRIDTNVYISPGYEQIWGRTQESLYQNPRSFLDAIHEDDRERIIAQLEVKKQGLPFDHEYRIRLPDGSIRLIRDRGFPIHDKNGNVIRYAGIAMDITRKQESS